MTRFGNDFGASYTSRCAISLALVVAGLAVECTARADCRDGLVDRMVDIRHADVEGFFIPTADTACLVRGLEIRPLLERRIRLLDDRLRLSDTRHALMLEAKQEADRAITALDDALDVQTRRLVECEDDLDSFWRSPFLWFGAGVVVAVAATVAVALVIGGS